MKKLCKILLKNKIIIVIVFILFTMIFAVLSLGVKVNYSMSDYLPENSQTKIAINKMKKEFGKNLYNSKVMISNISVQDALKYKDKFNKIKGVNSVVWLDDVVDLTTPINILDKKLVNNYYKDNNALYEITINEDNQKSVVEQIYKLIDFNVENAFIGEAVSNELQKKLTVSETKKVIYYLLPLILVILVISTTSWIEPILFLVTIGVAVVINMGTNIFFKDISFITQSVSPILQLAVSLDYAVFLLHSFENFRKKGLKPDIAMNNAIKNSIYAISASAATTLFGFFALSFMKFGIGKDLGINLVKGILFSYIAVIVFMPALILSTYRIIEKTRHKIFISEIKKLGNFVLQAKILVLIIVVILIVPCYLAQTNNNFVYGNSSLSEGQRLSDDIKKIEHIFNKNNPIIILVPKGEPVKEKLLYENFIQNNNITSIVSYETAIGIEIPPEYLGEEISSKFYSQNYSRIVLNTKLEIEGKDTFNFIENVKDKVCEYYKDDTHYIGESIALYDIKKTIISDSNKINLLAIFSIACVILICFKSLGFPIILLFTIEAAIWINLSFPYFAGVSLNYIGFLVISTVQLGATVDYAILLSDNYRKKRIFNNKINAIKSTVNESVKTLIVSASILTVSGFCLSIISTNSIISELGLLLGRGTILSFISVICLLPALLYMFDKIIIKTTIKDNFMEVENEKIK